MKYSIEGFSQQAAVELGLKADELVLLRWFVDFYNTGKMRKMEKDGKEWVWVSYSWVLENMPIFAASRQAVIRKFTALVDAGVLEKDCIRNKSGSFAIYRFAENYVRLIDSDQGVCQKCQGGYIKNDVGGTSKMMCNESISNKSIINDKNKGAWEKERYYDNEKLNDELIAFIDYRKKIHKPIGTKHAFNLIKGKLDKFPSDAYRIAVLEQSMINGWQGVFDLKDKRDIKDNVVDDDEYVTEMIYNDDGSYRLIEYDGNHHRTEKLYSREGELIDEM